MNNKETLADIVKEMRLGSTGGLPCAYRIGRPNRTGETIQIDSVTVADLADRIEAAWKREQIGRDTLSDGRSLTVAVAEQRLHLARVEAEYSRLLNMAKVRGLLSEIERMAYKAESDNDEFRLHQLAINIGAAARAALVGPARNCDLIANELSIDPERVPAELNKYENAPIRELIRWIFAKAEPKGGMSKPEPEESAVAAVARNVAADMRCMELKCWKGRRMGAYAVALMLGAYASRLEGAYNLPPRKEDGAQ